MANSNLKKQPYEYPQLSFRVSQEDKARIHTLVDEVLSKSNKTLSPGEKMFRKNDVFVDALYLGLLTLKKKGQHLKKF